MRKSSREALLRCSESQPVAILKHALKDPLSWGCTDLSVCQRLLERSSVNADDSVKNFQSAEASTNERGGGGG